LPRNGKRRDKAYSYKKGKKAFNRRKKKKLLAYPGKPSGGGRSQERRGERSFLSDRVKEDKSVRKGSWTSEYKEV